MKHLILLRHTKSSWVNPDLEDFDRPLNKRGKRSAKALGKWFRASSWAPERVLCSAARRTRETWDGMELKGEPDLRKDLYHASPDAMLRALQGVAESTVLMIGHNPGISGLAHLLVEAPPHHSRFVDYPTGALLIAEFPVRKFSQIKPHSGIVREFLTPHDLKKNIY